MLATFRRACVRFVRCLRGVTAWEIGNAPARIAVQTRYFERAHASGTAEVRARDLLLRMLSPSQRKEFEFGYFSVNVPGRGKFWICPWRSLNVEDPSTGDCYCCTTEVAVPLYDLMLAQKLLLESDPDQFFSVANHHPRFVVRPVGTRAVVPGG